MENKNQELEWFATDYLLNKGYGYTDEMIAYILNLTSEELSHSKSRAYMAGYENINLSHDEFWLYINMRFHPSSEYKIKKSESSITKDPEILKNELAEFYEYKTSLTMRIKNLEEEIKAKENQLATAIKLNKSRSIAQLLIRELEVARDKKSSLHELVKIENEEIIAIQNELTVALIKEQNLIKEAALKKSKRKPAAILIKNLKKRIDELAIKRQEEEQAAIKWQQEKEAAIKQQKEEQSIAEEKQRIVMRNKKILITLSSLLGVWVFFVLLVMNEKAKYPVYTASITYTTEAKEATEAIYSESTVYTFNIDENVTCGVDVPADRHYTIDTPPNEAPYLYGEDNAVAYERSIDPDDEDNEPMDDGDSTWCPSGYEILPSLEDGETYTLTHGGELVQPAEPAVEAGTYTETLLYDSYEDDWSATSNGEPIFYLDLVKYDELEQEIDAQLDADGNPNKQKEIEEKDKEKND